VDLRIELDILMKEAHMTTRNEGAAGAKGAVKKHPKFNNVKITKNGTIFFLKAGKY
jgi:hypothetical protein